MSEQIKRLFFGLELVAPWPEKFPSGNLLKPENRHLTLAFLGNINSTTLLDKLQQHALHVPLKVGTSGYFERCLFLPPKNPNVASWGVHWLSNAEPLLTFQKVLVKWLESIELKVDHPNREWLPHATVSRRPFDQKEWEQSFKPIPFITKNIHLYESLGQLQYMPIWSFSIQPPFDEFEHTADIAFRVHGTNLQDIFMNAQTALCFKHPLLLNYISNAPVTDLDEVVIQLNKMIGKADKEIGSPYKAVSFHGDLQQNTDQTFTWEMIVDV